MASSNGSHLVIFNAKSVLFWCKKGADLMQLGSRFKGTVFTIKTDFTNT
jgi:hypothetical protein